ncbi:MAG TPA: NlpC/P60 family protein [Thermoleophilaceae bacterium]
MALSRRLALLVIAVIAVAAVPANAMAALPGNWNKVDQRRVVRAGLMTKDADGFHGERPFSPAAMRASLAALGQRTQTPPVQISSAPISVSRFDKLVVEQLGLSDLAVAVQTEAKRAGLRPPSRFGTEVVARQLGLRFNHPFPFGERLELYPSDRITRAEAAYSFARILSFNGWEKQYARDVLGRFTLPQYGPKQLAALRLAVSKIGMPYIWGGETDWPSPGQVHGGYDCSGLAWRVYKLSGNPAGRAIRGRTAAQQAGEIPKRSRVAFADIRPADLLFFGSAGFRSRATEASVTHEGIALSKDFMIHASSQGVYVSPLFEEWRRNAFAWARRVL